MEPAEWRAILDGDDKYEWAPDRGAPGAAEAELQGLAAWFGRPLPDDYAAMLRLANGAEIRYGHLWTVILYSTHEIPDLAHGYGITPETFPGAVLFGTDGGSDALLFDIRPQHPDGVYPVYCIDFIEANLGWEAANHVADDFRGLLLLRKRQLHEVQLSRMPLFTYSARLEEPLLCPHCGTLISGGIVFQWGQCTHIQDSRVPPAYHLGDPIQWYHRPDETILPWTYTSVGEHGGFANMGDPTVPNLVTRDVFQFERDPALPPRICLACGHPLAGAAVEIRDSILRRAWVYTADGPDAMDNTATDYLVQPDGTLVPVTGWIDHPIEMIEEEDTENDAQ